MTVEQLAKEWLNQKAGDVKRNTYEGYMYTANKIVMHYNNKQVEEIKYDDVQNMVNDLYCHGMCKATIKKRRQVIKGMLQLALKKGLIDRNPCDLATIPQNAFVGERRNLTSEEIKILLKSGDCPFGNFALFLYYTGLRRSEAIPLKWSDIDFVAREICVSRVVSYLNGKTYIDNYLKNKDKSRIIPINQKLMEILEVMPKTNEYVFTNKHGGIMARNTVTVNWKKFQECSNLKSVTPHMLRHTFATNLYQAGVDVKTIQKITGHRDLKMLFDRYIHADKELVKQATNIMDKFYAQYDKG